MTKRVLITGVSGMAGSHLAELAVAEGAEVWGLVRWRSTRVNLTELEGRIHLVEGDVRDQASLRRAVEQARPDVIFHLAAQSFVPYSWVSPADTAATNVGGTIHLLEAVRDLGLSDVMVHVAGSAEEYGLVHPSEVPISEEQPLRPLSPYGVSKVAQDLLAWQYHRSHGIRTVRTRAFNHEGPRRGDAFVTSSFARQLVEIEMGRREPVLEVGNLDARRDWHDVRDTVRAYWLLAERADAGEVYNVGAGRSWSVGEMLDMLLGLSSAVPEVRPVASRMRPSDVPRLEADVTRLHECTGWKAEIPLERTLADTLDWWRQRLG